MRDDYERLLDLREAIERIEKYTTAGRAALERDELIQTWVIYHLQIIGEAALPLTRTTRPLPGCSVVTDHRHAQHPGTSLFRHRCRNRLVGGGT